MFGLTIPRVSSTPVTGRACTLSASEFIRVDYFRWTLIPRKRARKQSWDVSTYGFVVPIFVQATEDFTLPPSPGFQVTLTSILTSTFVVTPQFRHATFDFPSARALAESGCVGLCTSVSSTTACGSPLMGRPHSTIGGLYTSACRVLQWLGRDSKHAKRNTK